MPEKKHIVRVEQIGTAAFSVTETSAGPLLGGFRQDGGNRGW